MKSLNVRAKVLILVAGLLCGMSAAWADVTAADSALNAWLVRMHDASRQRAYTGTFVVSAGAKTASAKIWHVCDGTQQIERVEPLSGPPRSTFRRNDQVVTFFPEARVAFAENRDSLGLFPNLLKSSATRIGEYYQFKAVGSERVVGVDADVVQLVPKDTARYGYRVWSEKRTGLVVQLQTLDVEGRVLEQAAFSELQLDAPVSMAKLTQMMNATEGYRIETSGAEKTTAQAQGWTLLRQVAGFHPVGCFLRHEKAMQWTFSDGLATVSLFTEPFDGRRHLREGATDFGGATRTFARHFEGWWITAVGEVPASTLSIFAQALARAK